MICRLCFQDNNNCFHLFDCEGITLEAATIIGKHFWFEPKEKDTESLHICRPCWSIVDGFHNLYILVENAQNKLGKITFDEHSIFGNQLKSIIDLKSENVSLKSEDIVDDEFLSNSEYLQSTLNDFCEDSIAYDASETKESKVQKIKVETITEINIAISEEVRDTRSRSKLEEKLWNNKITQGSEELKHKIAPIKKKKRGRPSAAEVEERKSKQTDLKPLEPKTTPNETASDDEINKIRRITCQICLIEIPTFFQLKKHFLQVHDEPGYAICCDKKFFKRNKFVNHLKICDHIQKVHAKIEKGRNFTCETCSKSFAKKGSLTRHLLSHIPENEKLFQCDLCENSFPTHGLLRTHKITAHEGRYGGICALCGKKYKNPQELKRHCLEHEGISQPKVQCEVCEDCILKYLERLSVMEFSTTNKQNKVMLYQGFEYTKYRETENGVITWRCRVYFSTKCRAFLRTQNESIIGEVPQHCHESNPQKAQANILKARMKKDIKAVGATARHVMGNILTGVNGDVLEHLPKQSSLTRNLLQHKENSSVQK